MLSPLFLTKVSYGAFHWVALVGLTQRNGRWRSMTRPCFAPHRGVWALCALCQTITPLRRFRLILSLCLSARHKTRTRRDPQRAPRPRHAHRPIAARAGQHAQSRAKRHFFFRVVVVVVSSVVRLGSSGTTPNAPPSRKPGTGFRALVKYDLKRTRSPLFRTCLVAFLRDDGTERRPGTCEHFRWLGTGGICI